MINFAHRGFSGKYPENTMLAFEKAVEAGASGIELDVQLTKDGEVVIIHDESLDRTTDARGLVCEKTLDQIQKLNASILYPSCENQRIPTLCEYLDLIKNKGIITNIELKNSIVDYPDIEKKVYDLIREFDVAERVIISSFNHNSLVRIKEIDSSIKCGVLESSRLFEPWTYVKNLGMEYFHPMNFTVTKEVAENCASNNIALNIWFGQSENDYNKYLKLNPSGLITDFPNRLGEILN